MGWEVVLLSGGEERGIGSVGVKWVDIGKKRSGEGGFVECK